ncbi:hypothetical protein TeGR_g6257 [Tetraparma gracilis]|uniref:Protein kinase domain-containing protein n=1 Tax=Tetraparma gracilis TaxID=2962635 RepID=A0ABQ6M417_9STRA|nr:hypothetical protein TeGR_g6257 [Tetraparma gracilis]
MRQASQAMRVPALSHGSFRARVAAAFRGLSTYDTFEDDETLEQFYMFVYKEHVVYLRPTLIAVVAMLTAFTVVSGTHDVALWSVVLQATLITVLVIGLGFLTSWQPANRAQVKTFGQVVIILFTVNLFLPIYQMVLGDDAKAQFVYVALAAYSTTIGVTNLRERVLVIFSVWTLATVALIAGYAECRSFEREEYVMYSDFGALIQEEFAELIVNATPTTDFTPSKSKLAVLECKSHCDECMTFVGMGTSIVSLTWIAIVLVGYTVHNTRNLRDKFLQLWRENRRNFEILKRMTAAEYMDDETKAKITAVMADLQSGKRLTEESKDKLAKENEFRGSTRSVPKVVSGSNSFNSKNSAEDEVRNVAAKVNADLITVAETDDIDLHEVIGQGSQGVVYRGIFKNEKDFIEVAVKQLLPKAFDETNIMRFHDEIKLMSTIRHPNIIRMVGCSFDPIRLCMLLEFAAKGSLAALLKYSFAIVCVAIHMDTDLSKFFFNNKPRSGLIAATKIAKEWRPKMGHNIPVTIGKLVQRCWAADPHKRPTFGEICAALDHVSSEDLMEVYTGKRRTVGRPGESGNMKTGRVYQTHKKVLNEDTLSPTYVQIKKDAADEGYHTSATPKDENTLGVPTSPSAIEESLQYTNSPSIFDIDDDDDDMTNMESLENIRKDMKDCPWVFVESTRGFKIYSNPSVVAPVLQMKSKTHVRGLTARELFVFLHDDLLSKRDEKVPAVRWINKTRTDGLLYHTRFMPFPLKTREGLVKFKFAEFGGREFLIHGHSVEDADDVPATDRFVRMQYHLLYFHVISSASNPLHCTVTIGSVLDFNGRMPKFFMDSIKTNIHKREEVYIKEFEFMQKSNVARIQKQASSERKKDSERSMGERGPRDNTRASGTKNAMATQSSKTIARVSRDSPDGVARSFSKSTKNIPQINAKKSGLSTTGISTISTGRESRGTGGDDSSGVGGFAQDAADGFRAPKGLDRDSGFTQRGAAISNFLMNVNDDDDDDDFGEV